MLKTAAWQDQGCRTQVQAGWQGTGSTSLSTFLQESFQEFQWQWVDTCCQCLWRHHVKGSRWGWRWKDTWEGVGRADSTVLSYSQSSPKVLPYSGACPLWHSKVILSMMSSPLGWNIILLQNWPERGWFAPDRSMSHVRQGKMMTGQGEREPFKRVQALKRQLVQKTMKVSSNPEVLQFYIWIGPKEKILIHMRNKKLPWWLRWRRIYLQCRRPGLDPSVRKIPWRRKWQPTPVFSPGESHGQRSLVGYSPRGLKESDTTE